jgi:membrane protein implicated in regulation of membrane protease activity
MNGVLKWAIVAIVALSTLPVILSEVVLFSAEHKTDALQERGVGGIGTVTRLSVDAKDHRYRIGYSYAPKEFAGRPYATAQGEAITLVSPSALKIGGNVEIVYDPKDPDNSALMSEVEHAHRMSFWFLLLFIPSIFAAILSLMLSAILYPYFRERSLLRWGKAVHATIVGEVADGLSGAKLCRLSFVFEDNGGNTVNGKSRRIPASDHPNPAIREYRSVYLSNPTAIFDPRNSKRHMLYPGGFAKLSE